MMAEAQGSGIPLGWIFIRAQQPDPPVGTKENVLNRLLCYFKGSSHGQINAQTTHSDKDWSEIGAMMKTWPDAHHQLCYWHALNSVRKRIGQQKLAPGFYDSNAAHLEYNFIRPSFVPRAQLDKLTFREVM